MALAAPLAVTMAVLRDCAMWWGGRRKGVEGGGEVVTLVVSGLGSLSLVKRTPPWETDAAGATAAV